MPDPIPAVATHLAGPDPAIDETPRIYDPQLGLTWQTPEPAAHVRHGYAHWPDPHAAMAADLRLLVMGNSTSMWRPHVWALDLARRLARPGRSVGLFLGATPGASAAMDLVRLVRDAPAIRPHLVLTLTGITDLGYIIWSRDLPFLNKYQRELIAHLKAAGRIDAANHGMPEQAEPHVIFARQQRLAAALAAETGARHVCFLQPVMGVGTYPASAAEQALYASKAAVVLKAYDRSYGEALTRFYAALRPLCCQPGEAGPMVDLTDAFAHTPSAYYDHRHYTAAGHAALADSIAAHLTATDLA